jgi:hypothetical protein
LARYSPSQRRQAATAALRAPGSAPAR